MSGEPPSESIQSLKRPKVTALLYLPQLRIAVEMEVERRGPRQGTRKRWPRNLDELNRSCCRNSTKKMLGLSSLRNFKHYSRLFLVMFPS